MWTLSLKFFRFFGIHLWTCDVVRNWSNNIENLSNRDANILWGTVMCRLRLKLFHSHLNYFLPVWRVTWLEQEYKLVVKSWRKYIVENCDVNIQVEVILELKNITTLLPHCSFFVFVTCYICLVHFCYALEVHTTNYSTILIHIGV